MGNLKFRTVAAGAAALCAASGTGLRLRCIHARPCGSGFATLLDTPEPGSASCGNSEQKDPGGRALSWAGLFLGQKLLGPVDEFHVLQRCASLQLPGDAPHFLLLPQLPDCDPVAALAVVRRARSQVLEPLEAFRRRRTATSGSLFSTLKLRQVTLLLSRIKRRKLSQSRKSVGPGAGSAALPIRPTTQ